MFQVLENIELNKKSMYSRVPACQITTYYYVGFAYMMMRRYADAIRTFSNILVYIQRTKAMFQTRNYQNDQINKQVCVLFWLLSYSPWNVKLTITLEFRSIIWWDIGGINVEVRDLGA